MATNRSSQRGVIRVASAAIAAAFGALLSLGGCSSEQGSGGSERLGSVSQAISCGKLSPCPPNNECVTYKCNLLTAMCDVSYLGEGAACGDASTGKGTCAGFSPAGQPVLPVCCKGCVVPLKALGYACNAAGDQLAACGTQGARCDNCNSNNSCIKDACVKGVCEQTQVQDKDPCLDNSGVCWQGSCCSGCVDGNDVCQPGSAVTQCGRSSSGGLVGCKDCTDGLPCTNDVCDARGSCSNPSVMDNTPCPDATKCNGDEVCKGGKCQGPASFSCADSNPCTADSCDAVNGCGYAKLTGTSCADANKCNGDEVCSSGLCGAGTPLDCNDNNPCTTDGCVAATGCVNAKQNGTSCADANKCNGAEMCVSGVCTPQAPPDCDDKNPCTVDSCDPAGGCSHSPVSPGTKCDDGNVCNGISTCSGTQCVAGTPLSCDDANVCTDDSCVPATGCKYVNNTLDCSDNDLCTTNDKCSAGTCKGGAATNCSDNETCTDDTCDPVKGCVHTPVAPNTKCDDGNACSTGEKCNAGKCQFAMGLNCDDKNPCTQDGCNVATQMCDPTKEKDGTPCPAPDKCHQNSTCQAGNCSAGEPVDCDDGNPCTIDSCDAQTGCKHVADNTAKCSDGDACTNSDRCKMGVCVGIDVVCAPLDECHEAGTCNPQGVCDDPRAADDKPCKGGRCQTGKCVPDPIGAGGAGGDGAGGDGTSGSVAQGGEPPVNNGGSPDQPSMGGAPGMGASSGTGAKGGRPSTGGSSPSEGGAQDLPEDRVFVRTPGGCSCRVPASPDSGSFGWLGALGVAALVAGRRRGTRSGGAAVKNEAR